MTIVQNICIMEEPFYRSSIKLQVVKVYVEVGRRLKLKIEIEIQRLKKDSICTVDRNVG